MVRPSLDPAADRRGCTLPPKVAVAQTLFVDMKLANSVSVALPRIIAPASRSFAAMTASLGGMACAGVPETNDGEPAVVGMSAGIDVVLEKHGNAEHRIRLVPLPRWLSIARASSSASGLR